MSFLEETVFFVEGKNCNWLYSILARALETGDELDYMT
jgi:hypothetical protein